MTILQAFKVVIFYPKNGQGNGPRFFQIHQTVTSLCCHGSVCVVKVPCWEVSELGRKHPSLGSRPFSGNTLLSSRGLHAA